MDKLPYLVPDSDDNSLSPCFLLFTSPQDGGLEGVEYEDLVI